MKNNKRMIRINDEIARETAEIIRSEMTDPRVGLVVSVLKAETTSDLKYCKIYVSVLGDEAQRAETMAVLRGASGFVRKCIADRINLRNTPEIKFVFDDSITYGIKMNQIIDRLSVADTNATEPEKA